MIDLHFVATPNGQKISIALEELGLPYNLIQYDIFEGHQHTAAYGRINPNHKMPAIVDHDPAFGGGPHAVFESGAILQYLAEKTGKLLPAHRAQARHLPGHPLQRDRALARIGGQASHFMRYAPEQIPYAIERYSKELNRLLHVLENRLGEAEYLAGDEYSIADIAIWPGRAASGVMDIDIRSTFPNMFRWYETIAQRPAVVRGRDAEKAFPDKYMQRNAKLTPEQWSNMFGSAMHGAVPGNV